MIVPDLYRALRRRFDVLIRNNVDLLLTDLLSTTEESGTDAAMPPGRIIPDNGMTGLWNADLPTTRSMSLRYSACIPVPGAFRILIGVCSHPVRQTYSLCLRPSLTTGFRCTHGYWDSPPSCSCAPLVLDLSTPSRSTIVHTECLGISSLRSSLSHDVGV